MDDEYASMPGYVADDAKQRATKVKKAAGGLWARGVARLQSITSSFHPERIIEVFDPHWTVGQLDVYWPNGEITELGGRAPGPHATIQVHNWRFIRLLLTSGAVGFARSYIEGDWDSPALDEVIEAATLNRSALAEQWRGRGWVRWLGRLRHVKRANTKENAKDNISFHYDLGNHFYSQWLDKTMTYSAALFDGKSIGLAKAQKEKYRRLARQVGLKEGDTVLEIGCGWGGFAEIAAKEFGAKVHGITLSQEQLDFAAKRIEKAGLSDKVTFELIDYRDVTQTFDHVVSIEMFEAVGEEYWPTYFEKVRDCLKPGGKASLQIITIEEEAFEGYRKSPDFIQTYIFPGGMLPSPSALKAVIDKSGLMTEDTFGMGQDYAQTLRKWRTRFETAWEEGRIPAGFDETFRRIWRYYLAYCEGGFRAGGIDVVQVTLAKAPDDKPAQQA